MKFGLASFLLLPLLLSVATGNFICREPISYPLLYGKRNMKRECEITKIINTERNKSIESILPITEDLATSLKISTSFVYYLPKGIEKFLSNLTELMVLNSKLREIHAEDLSPFVALIFLSLYGNNIQILEKDLFKNNERLESLNLYRNHIRHIDPNVFDNLKKLKHLDVTLNPCMHDTKYKNEEIYLPPNITRIVREIQEKCPPRTDNVNEWDPAEEFTDSVVDLANECSCTGLMTTLIVLGIIAVLSLIGTIFLIFSRIFKSKDVESANLISNYKTLSEDVNTINAP